MPGLSPDLQFPKVYQGLPKPSRTYSLDIATGVVGGKIDGLAAIKQFISKALSTIRFNHVIYSSGYGGEVTTLFGKGLSDPLVKTEIVRMVTEALIYDDRIQRVYGFQIEQSGDRVFATFQVDTVEGTYKHEEAFLDGI